jgi:hypothetical protein
MMTAAIATLIGMYLSARIDDLFFGDDDTDND